METGFETTMGGVAATPANGPEPECASSMAAYSWRANAHNRIIQYCSLFYSLFFFLTPYNHPSLSRWLWFAAFYTTFLLLYFAIPLARDGWHWPLLFAMFVLSVVYVPFNTSASGAFVYPVVISTFVIRDPRTGVAFRKFGGILVATVAVMFAEAWALHLRYDNMQSATFWMVAIGLSNFAYSRQQMIGDQLQRANAEIERLAQSAERERIARDLHDLLGHTLTVIVLKSDLANRIFPTDPGMAHREIAEVEETARKALAEVRDAVVGYRAEGFTAEVAQARRALAAAGVQLTTNVEPELLAKAQVNTLCLALREGVTNIVRHAGATACNLELRRDGEQVRLLLEDNGSGELRGEGSGLRGMRERLTALGGAVALEHSRSGGTVLRLQVPYKALPFRAGLGAGESA